MTVVLANDLPFESCLVSIVQSIVNVPFNQAEEQKF